MKLVLKQATKGYGATSPNPRVGAVIVKDGKEIVRGFHRSFGDLHAEAACLANLKSGEARGATLYVNLEPCCHQGKTPPCAQAIIDTGISRVVFGMIDPNQAVNGQGLKTLRDAGIEVSGPVLENEAKELNRGYLKIRQTGRPWVTLKFAQSLDGRIAAGTGDSRWISSPPSLKLAHQLRAENDAVLVGINTAVADNPQLTVRFARGLNPQRIVIDPGLRLNPESNIFAADPKPVLIATRPYPPDKKAARLADRGAEFIWLPPQSNDSLDLKILLDDLGKRGILYLLVEGGAGVFGNFINQGLFDEIIAVTAPILIGADGIPSMPLLDVSRVAEAIKLNIHKRKTYSPDQAVWYRPI